MRFNKSKNNKKSSLFEQPFQAVITLVLKKEEIFLWRTI